jgi:acyl-CoA synthetase (AMP-forming)/AMP-acid ligase II
MQITQLLRRAVQIRADGPAAICNGRVRSWREVEAHVMRLAGAMTALGFAPGDRIGILALNSDRYLEYYYAMAWGGFIFVPINTRLAPPEIVFWLADSGCTGLFIDNAFLPILEQVRAHTPDILHVVYLGDGPAKQGIVAYEDLIAEGAAITDSGRGGDDLAGIFYTGGTTGRSKGVMLSHANVFANVLNLSPVRRATEDTLWLNAAPMFHVAGFSAIFGFTGFGAKHAFITRFEPVAFLAAIERERVTDTIVVPTMLNLIVQHPDFGSYDTTSLTTLHYGASPMPEAVIRRALEAMPNTKFVQLYGQTEATGSLTVNPREYHVLEGPMAGRIKSAGRATIGCEVQILDSDDCEVPRGTIGEICGRGTNVMLGYWKQPELTERTLRNGWLHTGDGGYMDDQDFVYVVDRLKDMIISGGENVYSAASNKPFTSTLTLWNAQ